MSATNNERPVSVKLQTTIHQDGDKETFTFTETGTLVEMNGTAYLRYTEHQAGFETPVTFKVRPNGEVSLKRSGESATHLRFMADQTIPTRYTTAQGSMLLDVQTTTLSANVADTFDSGIVEIAYSLLTGETVLGDYTLRLEFSVN